MNNCKCVQTEKLENENAEEIKTSVKKFSSFKTVNSTQKRVSAKEKKVSQKKKKLTLITV